MMPATIARAASAGEAFSSVSTSAILVSIGPGYTPNTCVFCPRSIARVTWVSECVAALEALYDARIEAYLTDTPPSQRALKFFDWVVEWPSRGPRLTGRSGRATLDGWP